MFDHRQAINDGPIYPKYIILGYNIVKEGIIKMVLMTFRSFVSCVNFLDPPTSLS